MVAWECSLETPDNNATMSDYNNSNDGLTLNDANSARTGYASEGDIAKQTYGLDTPESNENPVNEESSVPQDQATMALGTQIENQEELLNAARDGDSEVTTADEDLEKWGADEEVTMEPSDNQKFKVTRDYDFSRKPKDETYSVAFEACSEFAPKTDTQVAANMGLTDLPVANQEDKDPIPERVDRREGEGLAGYEKRVGEEAHHEALAATARAIAEEPQSSHPEPTTDEYPVENAKYVSAWYDSDDEEEETKVSPTRQRAESTKAAVAHSMEQPAVAPSPDADLDLPEQVNRDLMDFDERAKLAAGMEPEESWSPLERIGEEILEIQQYVNKVAEKARVSKKQALILLCKARLETGSALESGMAALEEAPNFFKVAPTPIPDIHPRANVATVDAEVTHLFTPWNNSEYQVALMEDKLSGHKFRFIIHKGARYSKTWTEYNGDVVTDIREGDTVRIIDGKPHRSGGSGANVKLHASQWTTSPRTVPVTGASSPRRSLCDVTSRMCPRRRTTRPITGTSPRWTDDGRSSRTVPRRVRTCPVAKWLTRLWSPTSSRNRRSQRSTETNTKSSVPKRNQIRSDRVALSFCQCLSARHFDAATDRASDAARSPPPHPPLRGFPRAALELAALTRRSRRPSRRFRAATTLTVHSVAAPA
jgi:hypothetical protein